MRQILSAAWNAEPVRVFTALETLVALAVSGLVVFGVWSPTPEQLAWTTGAVAVIGAAFGVSVVRNRVTPWKPPAPPADAGFLRTGVAAGVVLAFFVGGAVAAIVAGQRPVDDFTMLEAQPGDEWQDLADRHGFDDPRYSRQTGIELRDVSNGRGRLRDEAFVMVPTDMLEDTPPPTTAPPTTTTVAPTTTVPPTTTLPPTTTTVPPTTTTPPTTVPPSGDWEPYLSGLSPAANVVLSQPAGFSFGPGGGESRFFCGVSHIDYGPDHPDFPTIGWDPIVAPGGTSGHSHTFWGNVDTNPDTTTRAHLRDGDGGSTCMGGAMNKSAYWVPTLLDAAGEPVVPDNIFVYYKRGYWGQDASSIQPLPEGLKMISTPELPNGVRQTGWGCTGLNTSSDFLPLLPGSCGTSHVTASILFQQCWDGVNLDSADHRSHMAHPIGPYNATSCPASHPVMLPQITAHVQYSVPAGGNLAGWQLSSDVANGLPAGLGLHGDFLEAWDSELHARGVNNCIRAERDCGVGYLNDGLFRPLPS